LRTDGISAADLKIRRQALGLTQRQLADALGVSANTLARWERGDKEIGQARLVKFAIERLEQLLSGSSPSHMDGCVAVPAVPNKLVGRDAELARVCELLGRSDVRLVTVTGTGGSGKTRLGVEAATRLARVFSDGVYFVDLAKVHDPRLIVSAVALSLGIRDAGGLTLEHSVRTWLESRCVLLVIDNFEHLAANAATVESLLSASERLKVLVTSRTRLNLQREVEVAIGGLATPPADADADVAALAHVASVELLLDRIHASVPDFAVTDANAVEVAQITRALDGLPLALELAGAKYKFLSTAEVLECLKERFDFLVNRKRDRPDRHQTLRACLDWSFELLSEPERALLCSVGVFAGSFTLAAAHAVHCSVGGCSENQVAQWLESLVDHSLVQVERVALGTRYGLLETIREYARAKSIEAENDEALARAHAEYCVALAEGATSDLRGDISVDALDRLEAEHANLRAALQWTVAEKGDPQLGLRLCAGLWALWWQRGYLGEGVRWLSAAIDAAPLAPQLLRAFAHCVLAFLHTLRGDFGRAEGLRAVVASFDVTSDPRLHAYIVGLWGWGALFSGDAAQSLHYFDDSIRVAEANDDRWGMRSSAFGRALVAFATGDFARADALIHEVLRDAQDASDLLMVASATGQLGFIAWAQGDYRRAHQLSRDGFLGFVTVRNPWGAALCLAGLARSAGLRGDWRTTVRLSAAAESLRMRAGAAEWVQLSWSPSVVLADARAQLPVGVADAEWSVGTRMPLAQVVEQALAIPAPGVAAAQSVDLAIELTPRERSVAELVAQGLTNRAIADQLVIAERTVETHLERIYAKLAIRSRSQLARWLVDSATR
jgi:non-specific serine/threonine protein kinase